MNIIQADWFKLTVSI